MDKLAHAFIWVRKRPWIVAVAIVAILAIAIVRGG